MKKKKITMNRKNQKKSNLVFGAPSLFSYFFLSPPIQRVVESNLEAPTKLRPRRGACYPAAGSSVFKGGKSREDLNHG